MEYETALKRLNKVCNSYRQLIENNRNLQNRLSKRDEDLINKVKRLETELADFNRSAQARWEAELRVARKEIEEQIRKENSSATEEKQTSV